MPRRSNKSFVSKNNLLKLIKSYNLEFQLKVCKKFHKFCDIDSPTPIELVSNINNRKRLIISRWIIQNKRIKISELNNILKGK